MMMMMMMMMPLGSSLLAYRQSKDLHFVSPKENNVCGRNITPQKKY